MALHHGIRVEVISSGRSLPLYADPEQAHNLSPQTPKYYLEAVTGAHFGIKISLTKDFVMGCDHVRIAANYGGTPWYGTYVRKPKWLLQRKETALLFDEVMQYDETSGGWRCMYLSFGRLDIRKFHESQQRERLTTTQRRSVIT